MTLTYLRIDLRAVRHSWAAHHRVSKGSEARSEKMLMGNWVWVPIGLFTAAWLKSEVVREIVPQDTIGNC